MPLRQHNLLQPKHWVIERRQYLARKRPNIWLIFLSQPKSAAPKPKTSGAIISGKAGRGRPRRGRNAGRPKPKTADELDAEMADYFDPNAVNGAATGAENAPTTNGITQSTTHGAEDMGMDEIS